MLEEYTHVCSIDKFVEFLIDTLVIHVEPRSVLAGAFLVAHSAGGASVVDCRVFIWSLWPHYSIQGFLWAKIFSL